MLMKIIAVNAVVFVALRLLVIIVMFAGHDSAATAVLHFIEMPSDLSALLTRPWTVVTYMFAQYDVMHLLFNMLWLYWFGVLFEDITSGSRLLGLYLLGGLCGALLFIVAWNVMPVFGHSTGWLIGSSASVIAIVAATAVIMPEFRFNLLFLGAVPLKWIAIVTIGLDLLGITGSNAGGHIAHLGGAVAGVAYALCRRRGIDLTKPFVAAIDAVGRLVERMKRPPVARPRETAADIERDRARMDEILEKIKHSGYSALTVEERRLLFEISARERKRGN